MPDPRHRSVVLLVAAALLAGCGGRVHVRLSVTPAVSLMDAPVHLTITGLAPHEHVALRDGSRSVPLVADASGRAAIRGGASLRLLWLLNPQGAGRMTLEVRGARVTLSRLARAPDVRIRLLRTRIYGDFYAPTHTARRPGILVFGGSEGGLSSFSRAVAALYASHGYPSLALAYFGLPGLPPDLHDVRLEYFATALRWLARRPGVDARALVVEGVSRGSEAAQLVGIHYPQLVHAVIAMVPGSGSSCGIPPFRGNLATIHCIGAAWTFRGRPVSYSLRGPATPYPFHDERIDGPVFLDCAGFDELWASCPMAEAIVARLQTHHFRHRVTLLYYPRAGHGVGPLLPSPPGVSFLDGATPESNITADANGWPRLLTFLRAVADS